MKDVVLDALLMVLVMIPVGDAVATGFFARLFWRSKTELVPGESRFMSRLLRGRSWLLALLVLDGAATTAVTAYLGYLAARVILDLPLDDNRGLYVAASLLVLGSVPILFMVAFWRSRR